MNLAQSKENMSKTLEALKSQLIGLGGQINISLVASIKITDSTGQKIPIEQIAITNKRPGSNVISITPYDPANLSNIEQGLKSHGFSAFIFSKREVAISIPPPSDDEKKKIITLVKKMGEDTKVALRNIRKTFRQKNKDDDSGEIDKIMNGFETEVNECLKRKLISI